MSFFGPTFQQIISVIVSKQIAFKCTHSLDRHLKLIPMYYVHTLSWTVLKINAVTAFLKETSAYHGSTNIWKMNCCSIFFVFYGYGHRFISGFIYIHGYCRIVHMVWTLNKFNLLRRRNFHTLESYNSQYVEDSFQLYTT